MKITHLDHLAITVEDLDSTLQFYQKVLGMELIEFGHERHALKFGHQKINLHFKKNDIRPHAMKPTPGSADLCFITEMPINEVIEMLGRHEVPIIEGPIERTGACTPLLSIYIHDPDKNLIEIANEIGLPLKVSTDRLNQPNPFTTN